MGRTSTVQAPRKVRSSKSKRKDEQPLYVALKARLLSAVYRVSYIDENYRGNTRRASHPAIKKHCTSSSTCSARLTRFELVRPPLTISGLFEVLERQHEHLERYPILRDSALTRAKQELVEAGLLVKPNCASFALGKDVRIKYKNEHDEVSRRVSPCSTA
jgi:hypothetical protein